MAQIPSPLDGARLLYDRVWSGPPEFVASAPGRVNLIGEHTDYNDGFVLPMAIDRRTAVAIGPGPGLGCEFVSTLNPEPISVAGPPWLPQDDGSWTNYPLGVMSGIEKALDVSVHGLRIAVASDVPAGSGLSSSAALEAATARVAMASLGATVGDRETARICQLAEHEFAGVRCGIMDQMASVFGGVVMLDCRSLEVTPVQMSGRVRVVILDSGIPRGLSSSDYNERREQCEAGVAVLRESDPAISALRDVIPEQVDGAADVLSETVYRRCRHVVTENERVVRAARALAEDEFNLLGALMAESHASMRDDYEISLPEIDRLVERAAAADGCYGARLTGAGFGGAAVAIVAAECAEAFAADVVRGYTEETGRVGSAMLVSADEGARVE